MNAERDTTGGRNAHGDGRGRGAAAAPLRRRLLARIQASHEHESQFVTVRRGAGDWSEQAGARRKPLAQTDLAESSLIELSPGATLPHAPGFTQIELVLLHGDARLAERELRCGDALCMPQRDGPALRAGPHGARLYVRLSRPAAPTVQVEHFSALEDDDASWLDFCPGVRIKPLWDGGERRSVLVRMQPGASVNAHGHALEEECMMLGGEAFIGDTLLRSMEYQLAPQGSRHGAITTDVGALFYVHGSLDPAAYL